MDPVSLALITAIGAGVTSSVTNATQESLAAGYTALKDRLLAIIGSTHPDVTQAIAKLEASPDSQARRDVLLEELTATQIPSNPELVDLAQTLLQQIKQTSTASQIIHYIQNSAISNTGIANNYNIQGDQHITQ